MHEARGISMTYIRAIKDMYEKAKMWIRQGEEILEHLHGEISLHQGSNLGVFLFVFAKNALTLDIQNKMP